MPENSILLTVAKCNEFPAGAVRLAWLNLPLEVVRIRYQAAPERIQYKTRKVEATRTQQLLLNHIIEKLHNESFT